jgi:NAD(P)-dependent dehydrogenase (short-subunit alcohol dehydrogenase family)
LLAADGARVVTVSSFGHRIRSRIDFDDLTFEHGYSRVAAYGRSKLANLLFTYELQRRLAEAGAATIAVAAHPGGSDTELDRNLPLPLRGLSAVFSPLFAQSAAMGALPTLRAATDPTVVGGQYYGPGGFRELRGHPTVVASSRQSHDAATQRRLWTVSEDLTGVTYAL